MQLEEAIQGWQNYVLDKYDDKETWEISGKKQWFDLIKEGKVCEDREEKEEDALPKTRWQAFLKFERMLWFELGKRCERDTGTYTKNI